MRQVIGEAFGVLVVGLLLATGLGLARGVPRYEPPAEATSCEAPSPTEGVVTPWVSVGRAGELHGEVGVAFVAGHVAGAYHAPMRAGVVEDEIVEALRGFHTVVAYCDTEGSCAASTRLAGLLASAGLPDVRVLEGGFPAWMDAELPAEAGECTACP